MYKISIHSTLNEAKDWDKTLSSSLFEQKTFLTANTATNSNITYYFVSVHQDMQLIGKLLLQIVPFKGEELKNYLSEDVSCFLKTTIEGILNKINWNIALVGNLFVSGDNGQHWHSSINEAQQVKILHQLSKQIKRELKPDTILISEISSEEKKYTGPLEKNRFKLFEIESEYYLNIPAHWNKFDDYLNDLKSKYKVRTRKVFKKSKDVVVKKLNAEEILENQKTINTLYKNVTEKISFKLGEVSENYFYDLKLALPQKFSLDAYYLDAKMIGFISTFDNGNTLEVHLIGLDYEINKNVSLYQTILYNCIAEAIAKNMKHIEFGKTAGTIKSTVGAQSKKLYSLLKHYDSVSNFGIKPFFKYLKPEPSENRSPFKQLS